MTGCLFVLLNAGSAQHSSYDYADILEQLAQNLEIEGAIEYNTILEQLTLYQAHPLNINRAELSEFVEVGMLSSAHESALRLYIEQNGPLISIYELQAVPGFDIDLIRRIRPFITVRGDLADIRQSLPKLILQGDREVILRWGRTLQDQKGFLRQNDGSIPFEGDPNRLYFRYRHRSETRLSYGITAEKDPGEAFFDKSNQGFDFCSWHIFLNRFRSWLPQVAVGDYHVNLGQGLIRHSGFAVGKSSFVTQVKKGGFTLRPFTSVNEFDFLRGVAITIRPANSLEISAFTSRRKVDGNVNTDTIHSGTANTSFSSLQLSGLHRTVGEIVDEGQIRHDLIGGNVKYSSGRWEVSLNAAYQSFSKPFAPPERPYNTFRFAGTSLTNVSIDYTYVLRNVHLFGETAYSDNGSVASINGILLSLHRYADISILSRILPRDFHTIRANTFGESSSGNNEIGTYFGMELRPLSRWTVSAYADFWRHPWLRFDINAPSTGQEQFVRLTYRKKRHHEFYIQYRNEIKERNPAINDNAVDILVEHRRRQLRAHMSHKMNNGIELRNRLELSWYDQETFTSETGFLMYQDIIYKPVSTDISFTARVAYFDTDGYNARIYAYENDLINQFYIPAYFDRGVRYYLNLSYRGIRNLTIQFRVAHIDYNNRSTVSSGNNEIDGNTRTDLKAQIIYRW